MDLPDQTTWYNYLDLPQRTLVDVSFALLTKKELLADLQDFSFLVFPMSKAYEGFLKQVFYDLHLIDKDTYQGRRFRIGRAFNPDIREHQRDEDWLYDDVASKFGHDLARQLWDTWLQCRNRVFHFFVTEKQTLTFAQAQAKIEMITQAMQSVAAQLSPEQ